MFLMTLNPLHITDVIQDEAIREQESKIEAEVAEKSPLIGDTIPLDALLNEYDEEDHVYRTKIMVNAICLYSFVL